jgi:hypothetical protein
MTTPASVVRQHREVFSIVRPGNVMLWHGDADMTHKDAMRHISDMGEYVGPAPATSPKNTNCRRLRNRYAATGHTLTGQQQPPNVSRPHNKPLGIVCILKR